METAQLYTYFLKAEALTTDSRSIPKNSIFFALKGENFNGNLFAEEAIRKGAIYAVVDEEQYKIIKRPTIPGNFHFHMSMEMLLLSL